MDTAPESTSGDLVMSDEARREWDEYVAAIRTALRDELYRQGMDKGRHTRQQVVTAIDVLEESITERRTSRRSTRSAGLSWAAKSIFAGGSLITASSLQGVAEAAPMLGSVGVISGAGMMIIGALLDTVRRR